MSPAEKRRFAVTFVLCIIGTFILILNVSHSRYGNTDLSLELVLSYGVLMACTLIFLMTDISTKSRRRKVDRFEDYFARFLARLLDARPLEAGRPGAERGRPQPPS